MEALEMEEKLFLADERNKAIKLKERIALLKKAKDAEVIFYNSIRASNSLFAQPVPGSYVIKIYFDDTWDNIEREVTRLEKMNVIARKQIEELIDKVRN